MGWLVQFAMGVAWWILPRRQADLPRGDPRPGWLVYGVLNLGVTMAAAAAFLPGHPGLAITGRVAEFLAVGLFAATIFPRVRDFSG